MKIVMLGFTGAGKTSYTASLYGALQRDVEGFSLRASNSDDHKRLLELADEIRLGKYPEPTDQRSEYEFQLKYQGKVVVPVSWSDYRGGALLQTQDNQQAKLLIHDLRQADCTFIFCDCDALAKGNNRQIQLGRMMTLVTNALQEVERSISLAVILTKIDLINNFYEDMLHPFSGLISAIEVSKSISGAFIPIACGQQLINVPMPLLFALSQELRYRKNLMPNLIYPQVLASLFIDHSSKLFDKYPNVKTWNDLENSLKLVEKLAHIRQGLVLEDYYEKINQIIFSKNLAKTFSGTVDKDCFDPFKNFV